MDRNIFIKELFQYAAKLQYKSRDRFIKKIINDKKKLAEIDADKLTETILDYARKYIINEFCQDGCEDSCCNRGYLKIKDQSEVRLLFGIDESTSLDELVAQDRRLNINEPWLNDTSYIITLDPCPMLDKGSCVIHDDIRRPAICKAYPILKFKYGITARTDCTPIKKGRLNGFINLIERHGYTVNPFP